MRGFIFPKQKQKVFHIQSQSYGILAASAYRTYSTAFSYMQKFLECLTSISFVVSAVEKLVELQPVGTSEPGSMSTEGASSINSFLE